MKLFIVGVLILSTAFIILMQRLRFLKQGVKTVATVIEFDNRDIRYKDMKPIFEFTTTSNEIIKYSPLFISAFSRWVLGEKVRIVYDSANPGKVLLITYKSAFGLVIFLLCVGMELIMLGGGYVLAEKFFETL